MKNHAGFPEYPEDNYSGTYFGFSNLEGDVTVKTTGPKKRVQVGQALIQLAFLSISIEALSTTMFGGMSRKQRIV